MTTRLPRHEQARRLQELLRRQRDQETRQERASFDGAMAALLDRIATRPPPPPPPPPVLAPVPAPTRSRDQEWWSHQPVLGFRMWDMRGGKLHGAWIAWEGPSKTAQCLDKQSKATGPVPHDASECRPPPCGIYALKGTRSLRTAAERAIRTNAVPMTLAIGLVAMTGRVIEHDDGYRAQQAEVVALALLTGAVGKSTILVTIDTPAGIREAFEAPRTVRSRHHPESFGAREALDRAIGYLRERALVRA